MVFISVFLQSWVWKRSWLNLRNVLHGWLFVWGGLGSIKQCQRKLDMFWESFKYMTVPCILNNVSNVECFQYWFVYGNFK